MTPTTLQDDLELLAERHEVDADVLSDHIRKNFEGSVVSLKSLEPLVREILRRFRRLPRKKSVDGTYPSLGGYRSFKAWCQFVLHRSDRTVRYMLSGGNQNRRQKPSDDVETFSAMSEKSVPAGRIINSLATQLSIADKAKCRYLVQQISDLLRRFQ